MASQDIHKFPGVLESYERLCIAVIQPDGDRIALTVDPRHEAHLVIALLHVRLVNADLVDPEPLGPSRLLSKLSQEVEEVLTDIEAFPINRDAMQAIRRSPGVRQG